MRKNYKRLTAMLMTSAIALSAGMTAMTAYAEDAATTYKLTVDADDVAIESTFIDDLGADSLDIVELIMAFEEEFGIEIPDSAAEKIKTVQDVVTFIDQNK